MTLRRNVTTPHWRIIRVVLHRGPGPGANDPDPAQDSAALDELCPSWLECAPLPVRNGSSRRAGICNKTHGVVYETHGPLSTKRLEEGDGSVHVWMARTAGRPPSLSHRAAANLLFTREVAPHIGFRGAGGFVGLVGYGAGALIRVPLFNHAALVDAATELPFEPQSRKSIGIWVRNCGCITRNRIIDTLVAAGLPVRSYGECRRNQNESWDRHALQDSAAARAECATHRLMLAVENEACSGWVSPNLEHAVQCGAIPIVHTVGGLPEYSTLFGDGGSRFGFPHIDASQRGWLTRVRLVMQSDSYYQKLLREGSAEAVALRGRRERAEAVGLAGRDELRGGGESRREVGEGSRGGDGRGESRFDHRAWGAAEYHCAWHDAELLRRPPARVEWGRCAYCEGEYDENEGL